MVGTLWYIFKCLYNFYEFIPPLTIFWENIYYNVGHLKRRLDLTIPIDNLSYLSPYKFLNLSQFDRDPHGGIVDDVMELTRILTPIDFERMFQESYNAKIINQGHLAVKRLSDEFTKAVFAESDQDVPYQPSCDCKRLKGQMHINMICPLCNTKVSTEFVDHLSHTAWLGIPEGLPKLLHPVWYMVLRDWLGGKKGESSIIDAILNPELELPKDLKPIIPEQSYIYFYQHADEILNILMNMYEPTKRKKNTPWIKRMYHEFKHILFTSKFPILHNSLHPFMSGSSTLKYVDKPCKEILNAIFDLSAITFSYETQWKDRVLTEKRKREINKTLYDIYRNIITYYVILINEKVGKKSALMRKHNFGTRMHFTIRSVVVPITGAHSPDEIYLPWKCVVNAYKMEIIGRLIYDHGVEAPKAFSQHLRALVHYDPMIHEIMEKLMKECPFKGLPFLIGRNPTLRLFSIMQLFCTKIKTNLSDQTISISPLILKGSNTDFDGDELNGFNIKEMAAVVDMDTMHPREAVLDTNSPNVSTLVMPSNQALQNAHNFLHQNPDTGYTILGGGVGVAV